MNGPQFFLGLQPDGTVTTIGSADPRSVLEAFQQGEIIVPCTVEQARGFYGQKVDPLNLPAGGSPT